jgi:hypothetical protein
MIMRRITKATPTPNIHSNSKKAIDCSNLEPPNKITPGASIKKLTEINGLLCIGFQHMYTSELGNIFPHWSLFWVSL